MARLDKVIAAFFILDSPRKLDAVFLGAPAFLLSSGIISI
jgi:hypothetical protein